MKSMESRLIAFEIVNPFNLNMLKYFYKEQNEAYKYITSIGNKSVFLSVQYFNSQRRWCIYTIDMYGGVDRFLVYAENVERRGSIKSNPIEVSNWYLVKKNENYYTDFKLIRYVIQDPERSIQNTSPHLTIISQPQTPNSGEKNEVLEPPQSNVVTKSLSNNQNSVAGMISNFFSSSASSMSPPSWGSSSSPSPSSGGSSPSSGGSSPPSMDI